MVKKKTVSINKNDTTKWKNDIVESVAYYNDWFMKYAPSAYIQTRKESIAQVSEIFMATNYFTNVNSQLLKDNPSSLSVLRMATMPPLAMDRLAGLAGVNRSFVKKLEEGTVPPRMNAAQIEQNIDSLLIVISQLLDNVLMPWVKGNTTSQQQDLLVATSVIADRLSRSQADPNIRNEQERRQLKIINDYLTSKGYSKIEANEVDDIKAMRPGTFSYHVNVPVSVKGEKDVNVSVDVMVKRRGATAEELPIMIECKSAGDYVNTNKRRKEEAIKMEQLRNNYGKGVEYVLFLCGYFDAGYLGYEAAEGIDWVWEHRIVDFDKLSL